VAAYVSDGGAKGSSPDLNLSISDAGHLHRPEEILITLQGKHILTALQKVAFNCHLEMRIFWGETLDEYNETHVIVRIGSSSSFPR